ncbi:hypothetical protein LV716_17365 [Flagellimonas sp. HMM57]|uniref:hypothetical protein n=1 Tax=unclassified Flagellimonas TaxID=2644544 RepID=UPI0013D80859|nr:MULTISPECIES: hypothetical protein [unclassified Flagellimonas]UII76012.1 hypothetical protein LV716_17365 [Flagellimonas sp. HMM57]
MKKIICSIVLTVLLQTGTDAQRFFYDTAFENINCMLEGSCELSFKNAVYEVENAYLENSLDSVLFHNEIRKLTVLAQNLVKSRELKYQGSDKEEVEKYAALFSALKDSFEIADSKGNIYRYTPYSYDFEDIWGHGDWKNMFVSKLMVTRKGNCHSLPYLYKILAEELEVDAYLALAPNHIYIKHWKEEDGWYNTELTSGIFPMDSWLMASGYIHLDAIANKLYMEALDNKRSVALCLIDLAQGYERKFLDNDGTFVQKCTHAALKHYPNYINALILKAETSKKILEQENRTDFAGLAQKASQDDTLKKRFLELQGDYMTIHELGYRRMPEEMYLDWLTSLKEEREKYENKTITDNN